MILAWQGRKILLSFVVLDNVGCKNLYNCILIFRIVSCVLISFFLYISHKVK